jgi:hypothetical protein
MRTFHLCSDINIFNYLIYSSEKLEELKIRCAFNYFLDALPITSLLYVII